MRFCVCGKLQFSGNFAEKFAFRETFGFAEKFLFREFFAFRKKFFLRFLQIFLAKNLFFGKVFFADFSHFSAENFYFRKKFFRGILRIFSGNFGRKFLFFCGKFRENFRFFLGNFAEKLRKNCVFVNRIFGENCSFRGFLGRKSCGKVAEKLRFCKPNFRGNFHFGKSFFCGFFGIFAKKFVEILWKICGKFRGILRKNYSFKNFFFGENF